MPTYYWHSYSQGLDPQVFGETVEALAADGTVTPGLIVDEARPECSPLHNGFDWNDARAAENYRKEQARSMLRQIRVQIDDAVAPERVFYHVCTETHGDVYATKARIISDEEMRAAAFADAMKLLRAARERFRDVQELANVWQEIDQLELAAV